jgi:phosphoribosylformylglycinamidine synthase
MSKIVVDVMPKEEILDPQGKAICGALKRMGLNFSNVRQGKRFELELEEGTSQDSALKNASIAAEKLLSNPVIESVISIRLED